MGRDLGRGGKRGAARRIGLRRGISGDTLEVWPKTCPSAVVQGRTPTTNDRQIALSIVVNKSLTWLEECALMWLRSRMRPTLLATSVRFATVAAKRSWQSVLVRPM